MEKKEKKKVGTINAFVIVFAVIIGCWLLSGMSRILCF